MGRKKRWAEDMQARFVEGTFDRIANALELGEDRTEFVRKAVEKELARREGRKRRLDVPPISDVPFADKRSA
jgi:archaellum biogenesis protein FlaJ (TadC family)